MGCNSSTPATAVQGGTAIQPTAPAQTLPDPEKGGNEKTSADDRRFSDPPSPREPLLKSMAKEEETGPAAPAVEAKSAGNIELAEKAKDKDVELAVEDELAEKAKDKDVKQAVKEPLLDARTAVVPTQSSPVKEYFSKFAGAGADAMPQPPLTQTAFSWFGSFTGIAILGLLHGYFASPQSPVHLVFLIPPFGAMAVLVFSACKAPLAQPRNVLLGNTIGGICGWLVFKVMCLAGLESLIWLSAALAVSLTIVVQEHAKAVHPPGGATALAFIIVAPLHALDFVYIFCPALLGAIILVVVGLFTNNLSAARTYPQGWGFGTMTAYKESPEDSALKAFFGKFAGAGVEGQPAPDMSYSGFSFMGSFLGIAALGLCDTYMSPAMPQLHLKFLIASFGAMAVLIRSTKGPPFAAKKRAFGQHYWRRRWCLRGEAVGDHGSRWNAVAQCGLGCVSDNRLARADVFRPPARWCNCTCLRGTAIYPTTWL